MTEISEAAKAKAQTLLDETGVYTHTFVLARFIQQVSDAAKVVAKEISKSPDGNVNYLADERLAPFILPEPVDPLLIEAREIALEYALPGLMDGIASGVVKSGDADGHACVAAIIAALKRGVEIANERGLKIVEDKP